MDITNKTRKPLSLPLPGGKRLFLAPGKTGQVSAKDLAYPPLAKLLEAGDLETTAAGSRRQDGEQGDAGSYPGARRGGSRARRQYGDR